MTLTSHTHHCNTTPGTTEPDTRQVVADSVQTATVWKRFMAGLQRWRRNQAAWRHLSKLPDDLLEDVGLTRQDARERLDRPLIRYWHDDRR